MKKFKVGDLVKLSYDANKWYFDHADEIYSQGGILKIENNKYLLNYGVDRFSFQNNLDIFALIEGDNGSRFPDDFAYRVYLFNELGEGWTWVAPYELEEL